VRLLSGLTAIFTFLTFSSASAQAPASPEKLRATAEATAEQARRFASAPAPASAPEGTAWRFEFQGLSAPKIPMTAFRGDVVLVVNTASKCGYTPQYEGLQRIHETFSGRGFSVLGIPTGDFGGQELASSEEIRSFCELNYGVTFPMAAKTRVSGAQPHPFFAWAKDAHGQAATPRWNFHKILIGRDGRIVAAFPSSVSPESREVTEAIRTALKRPA